MDIGLIRPIDINDEMKQSYLDYAMSVIVSRALPDSRDGLKPVHRRILYAMHAMNMGPEASYKKSARIVGEVLGKYHPHGDMAVYESMARMAQDFSMRYPLIDGQGNYGSIDGDSPAAMRYTEARMAQPASLMLEDLEKDTVVFRDNFDGTLQEPGVLPAAFPNLLVNGVTGIAVGMSTSIPPHNLGEVVDALDYMLENWKSIDKITVEELTEFIQGPDFPTGGVIIEDQRRTGLKSAYGVGRGKVRVRAKAIVEEMSRGRHRIVITEIPYMTKKVTVLERIAKLVRDEEVEGIADLRDESDRQGMRIVIELMKSAQPEEVLEALFKRSSLENTFSIIMLALVDDEPKLLSLKGALLVYLEHRLEILKSRSQYDLKKAQAREHILEGITIALDNLDAVIDTIRKSRSVQTARNNLMREFSLTEIQAQAILDMPLRRLAGLERKKIEDEYKQIKKLIKELTSLIKSPKKMREVIGLSLQEIKERFSDPRRTQIAMVEGGVDAAPMQLTQLTPSENVWVMINREGLVARTPGDDPPRPSGWDVPKWMVRVNTRDTLYLVSENGEAAAIPAHTIPETEKPSQGTHFSKLTPFKGDIQLASVFGVPPKDDRNESWHVVTVTEQSMLKKSEIGELPGPSAQLFTLVKVNENDKLVSIRLSDGKKEIFLATSQGMAIRFSEEDVRPMGLVAAGVNGMKLDQSDRIIGMEILPKKGELFFLTVSGKAKRVKQDDFPIQGRYGKGVIAWKLPDGDTIAGMTVGKGTMRVTVHLKEFAPKSTRLDDAPLQTRVAQKGKEVVEMRDDDRVVLLTIPWEMIRPVSEK
ncbi:MAG: DNA topoisomerase 4 subunit A [Anaerolineales bacterium]|nr:DNA topoisomerase 4 subunit A [Anaerolineales bacterium]